MFKNNKYTKHYYLLIEKAIKRNWKKARGRERHHIIPKSIGGTDEKDNLVYLSCREHALCHWALVKMTEGVHYIKMSYAFNGMNADSGNHQRYHSRIITRAYEKHRIEHAKIHSAVMKAKNLIPWNKGGVEITDEHRENLVKAAKNRDYDSPAMKEGQRKRLEKLKDYKHSEGTKEKQRLSQTGKIKGPQSEEHRAAISESCKGKPKCDGHGDNVRKANTGNISINKDGTEKKVKRDTLDQWLSEGWQLGGRKRK